MTPEQKLLYEILGEVKGLATKVEINTVYQKVQDGRLKKVEAQTEDLIAQKNISTGKKTVWTMVAGAIGALIMKGLTLIHIN